MGVPTRRGQGRFRWFWGSTSCFGRVRGSIRAWCPHLAVPPFGDLKRSHSPTSPPRIHPEYSRDHSKSQTLVGAYKHPSLPDSEHSTGFQRTGPVRMSSRACHQPSRAKNTPKSGGDESGPDDGLIAPPHPLIPSWPYPPYLSHGSHISVDRS